MDELTDGKGVIFSTGTPISNSMTEMYTMQRYLQHDRLSTMSLIHFDAWVSIFGENTTSIELAPEVYSAISKPLLIATDEITTNTGTRHFILMQIDSPTMRVDEAIWEIDPGRGTSPVIVNGRTLVPIRAIAEAMGGTVDWNDSTRTVSVDCAGRSVEMTIDSKMMYVNSFAQEMDIAPQIINERTVLPIRFVSEALGCAIEWIGSTRQVVIVFNS
jgi:hypothetical protein